MCGSTFLRRVHRFHSPPTVQTPILHFRLTATAALLQSSDQITLVEQRTCFIIILVPSGGLDETGLGLCLVASWRGTRLGVSCPDWHHHDAFRGRLGSSLFSTFDSGTYHTPVVIRDWNPLGAARLPWVGAVDPWEVETDFLVPDQVSPILYWFPHTAKLILHPDIVLYITKKHKRGSNEDFWPWPTTNPRI